MRTEFQKRWIWNQRKSRSKNTKRPAFLINISMDLTNLKNIPVRLIKPGGTPYEKYYDPRESLERNSIGNLDSLMTESKYLNSVIDLTIINEKYGILFIPIPKNASTSIRKILGHKEKTSSIEEFNQFPFLKIAVIREPIGRFISGLRQFYEYGNIPEYISMKDIKSTVSYIEDSPWYKVDEHLRLQSWFIQDLKIDQILRLEHLEEDWDSLGLPKLPWLNQGKNKKGFDNIEEIVRGNKDLKERIMDLYQEDYKLYSRNKRPAREGADLFHFSAS